MRKKFLLTTAAIVTMFAMAIPSYASHLNSFQFNYATGGAQYTDSELKTSQSQAYMECNRCVKTGTQTAANGRYSAVVYGSTSETTGYKNQVTPDGKASPTYTFTAGTKHYMDNYAYQVLYQESKKNKVWVAVLGTMTGGDGYISMSGYWKPQE